MLYTVFLNLNTYWTYLNCEHLKTFLSLCKKRLKEKFFENVLLIN